MDEKYFQKMIIIIGENMMDELWEKLEEISKKEDKECFLESIQEEEARKIFDRYASRYDEALRNLS